MLIFFVLFLHCNLHSKLPNFHCTNLFLTLVSPVFSGMFQNGIAEGEVDPSFGPLEAFRLTVLTDSPVWVILSEVRHCERVKRHVWLDVIFVSYNEQYIVMMSQWSTHHCKSSSMILNQYCFYNDNDRYMCWRVILQIFIRKAEWTPTVANPSRSPPSPATLPLSPLP